MAKKAKLIPRKFLSSDERVVFESRPSAWLHMKAGGFVMLIGIIALIIFAWKWSPNAPDIPYISDAMDNSSYGNYVWYAFAGIFVLCLIYFTAKWLQWSSTVYAAT